jgi:hypothetical protein
MLCILFLLRNDTFICVSLESSVIIFVYFSLHMAHLDFWCCRSVFLLCLRCFGCLVFKVLLCSLLRNAQDDGQYPK